MTLEIDRQAPAHLFAQSSPVLVRVLRSGHVESAHRGNIAVTDSHGRLVASAGDALVPVFWRSAAKLHQAIPLVLHRGMEQWQLTRPQLAIICGSHNGTPEQV